MILCVILLEPTTGTSVVLIASKFYCVELLGPTDFESRVVLLLNWMQITARESMLISPQLRSTRWIHAFSKGS